MENWIREDVNLFKINCEKHEKIKVITNKPIEDEFFNYANNFKEAASTIAKDALYSNKIAVLDINFFSLAFLYRHSIELSLKAIGFQYITENEERKKFLNKTRHNLYDISTYISEHIQEYIDIDKEAYDWMMNIFEDMNDIDKESDSFRYPFSIIKKETDIFNQNKKEFNIKEFFDKQTHINLLDFANKMEIVFDILKSYYLREDNITEKYKEYRPVFLEEGGGYYSQSVIGYGYNRNSFYYNIQSYRNGAKVLYNHSSKNLEQRNSLFMPLCYLYRNSIELSMKDILFDESSYTYQETLKLLNKNKHKLLSIWKSIKSDIIKHCCVSKDDKLICDVERYISELNNIDGAADKFRYPTDKYMNLHFKRGKSFDVNNVKDFFEYILSFFNSVSSLMSEQNQMLKDMESEYMNY